MRILAIGLLCSLAAPALAELAADADPVACVAELSAANQPVADCVNRAQSPCFQFEAGTTAGTACFIAAKDAWGGKIAARIDEIRSAAPENIAAIAAIEAKYDVLQNLAQCDRIEEISVVRDVPSEQISWLDSRCEATAVGLAYVKLLLQSQGIE